MQTSINFIVTIIIAITIVGLGLTFFSDVFQQSQELTDNVGEQRKQQLRQMMDNGDPVTILAPSRDIPPGESAIFTMGITNTNSNQIELKLTSVIETSLSNVEPTIPDTPFNVSPNERSYQKLRITVPPGTSQKTHIITVNATCTDGCTGTYHNPVKLYINVP